uniref:Genome polyprotein n=1 Tax=Human hepegivirus TaxID=1704090 RepID=A0A2S1GGU2_9FLAV|nr:polyprotein [Human hepegivirus]
MGCSTDQTICSPVVGADYNTSSGCRALNGNNHCGGGSCRSPSRVQVARRVLQLCAFLALIGSGMCSIRSKNEGRIESGQILQSQRACWTGEGFAFFSNCCNQSDIMWCLHRWCVTRPGCLVCTGNATHPVCWDYLGSGVSRRPARRMGEGAETLLRLIGIAGWLGLLAETLGMSEFYAAILCFGFIAWYGWGIPKTLVCTVCPAVNISPYSFLSPDTIAFGTWILQLPGLLWQMFVSFPILYSTWILWLLLSGKTVAVIAILLASPTVMAYKHQSDSYLKYCTITNTSTSMNCDCPFGTFTRNTESRFSIPRFCPVKINSSTFICSWGSWWWFAENITRPYSDVGMPPAPISALCYIYSNNDPPLWYHNTTIIPQNCRNSTVDPTTAPCRDKWGNATACILDRRSRFCGDCYGGCFYTNGSHERSWERCGIGYRDGLIEFVQLGQIRPNISNTTIELLAGASLVIASGLRAGFGCSRAHGVVHCYRCPSYRDLEQFGPGLGKWVPLPGEPVPELCINPQWARRGFRTSNNPLSLMQTFVEDIFLAPFCSPTPGRVRVCNNTAFYPRGGGFVQLIGDVQVLTPNTASLHSLLTLISLILLVCVVSGARFVPLCIIFFWSVRHVYASCYLSCDWAVCNDAFCFTSGTCATVNDVLCLPVATRISSCGHAVPPPDRGWEVPAALSWAISRTTGLTFDVFSFIQYFPTMPGNNSGIIYCGEPTFFGDITGIYWPYFLPGMLLLYLTPFLGLRLMLAGFNIDGLFPLRHATAALRFSTSRVTMSVVIACLIYILSHPVNAALNRMFLASANLEMISSFDTYHETILYIICLLLYLQVSPRAGLAAMVAIKLSRGLLFAVVLAHGVCRPGRVFGLEVCADLTWMVEFSGNCTWYMSCVFSFWCVVFALTSPLGRQYKLQIYRYWAQVYARLILAVGCGPLGREFHFRASVGVLWCGACMLWPRECSEISLVFILCALTVDTIDTWLVACLSAGPSARTLATLADDMARIGDHRALRAVLCCFGSRGTYIYNHMGQVSERVAQAVRDFGGCLEPVVLEEPTFTEVVEDTMSIVCGQLLGGKPVVARCGTRVLVGHLNPEDLPPGFQLSAPVVITKPGIGAWSFLKATLTGRAETPGSGQIVVLSSLTGRSMGTAVNGTLYATGHGAGARGLATCAGLRTPLYTALSDDVVAYSCLPGMSSLEPCSCTPSRVWVMNNSGGLVCGRVENDDVCLDCPTHIDQLRGASGSPVLCDHGHAYGLMLGGYSTSGICARVRMVQPWRNAYSSSGGQGGMQAPAVTPTYSEITYYAPTGSGKSTKYPVDLVKQGHKVLVLLPSVAVVKSMAPYIKETYKIRPEIRAGTGPDGVTVITGENLAYMTYGRFLVDPETNLRGYAVVICDECHDTASSTLLGIGAVRMHAEKAGVKTVVFATATPAGIQVQPHPNIDEYILTDTGDVDFYGAKIKLDNIRTGRHAIFCHSKARCAELTQQLSGLGIRAVSFWRGCDIKSIPASDSIVVVTTDALSTGYTGNFDSVIDCGCCVEQTVTIDMDPTFSISARVVPCTAALRMQRRGRTGRGRRGAYYTTTPGAAPCVSVPDANVWQAVETAMVFYDWNAARIQQCLAAYHDLGCTPRISCDPHTPVRVMDTLRAYLRRPEVTTAALAGEQWPLLYGVQLCICKETEAHGPDDGIKWKCLLNNTNKTPLLYALDNPTLEFTTSHDLTRRIAGALSSTVFVEAGYGPILLAGAVMAASFALAGATGALVPSAVWSVDNGLAGVTRPDATDETAAYAQRLYQACADSGILASLQGTACAALSKLADASRGASQYLAAAPPSPAPLVQVLQFLETNFSSIASFGLLCAGCQAGECFTALAGLVSGATAGLGGAHKWLLAIAGTWLVSLQTGPRGGMVAGLSVLAGCCVGSVTGLDFLFGCLTGWEAVVGAAVATQRILSGTADMTTLVDLLPALFSPGAGIAGVVLVFILSNSSVTTWANRLLSMCAKQTLCDNYFLTENFGKQLSKLSLWRAVYYWAQTREGYTQCGVISGVWGLVLCVLRAVWDWAAKHVPRFRVPMIGCSPAWCGRWLGTGTLLTTCGCGERVSLQCLCSTSDPILSVGRWCRCSWSVGFPFNPTTTSTGTLRPDISEATKLGFRYGVAEIVELERRDGKWHVCAASCCLDQASVASAVKAPPVTANGVPISTFSPPQTYKLTLCSFDSVCMSTTLSNPAKTLSVCSQEAVELLEETVDTAQVMMCQNLEARRRAEYDAWQVRQAVGDEYTRLADEDVDSLTSVKPPVARAAVGSSTLDDVSVLTVLRELGDQCQNAIKFVVQAASRFVPPVPRPRTRVSGVLERVRMCMRTPPIKFEATAVPIHDIIPEECHIVLRCTGCSDQALTVPYGTSSQTLIRHLTNKHSHYIPNQKIEEDTEITVICAVPTTRASKLITFRAGDRSVSCCHPLQTPIRVLLQKYGLPMGKWADCNGPLGDDARVCDVNGVTTYEPCMQSYSWFRPIVAPTTPPLPATRSVAGILRADTSRVYTTTAVDVSERQAKVTIDQKSAKVDPCFRDTYNCCLAKAKTFKQCGMSYEDAVSKMRANTTRDHNTGITYSDLVSGRAKPAVQKIVDQMRAGVYDAPMRIIPKPEVFPRDKSTRKPPRFIVFPGCAARVAEKMILGDPGAITKHVLGDAYGFATPPHERARLLEQWWNRATEPQAIAVDAICFDSTITAEDMDREANIVAAAHADPEGVHGLYNYYKRSPMCDITGNVVGMRCCRASGTLTTSSGNTLTCYLKVRAACTRAGIKPIGLLIHGDDTLIITERCAQETLDEFSSALDDYGFPHTIQVSGDLSSVECCSARVDSICLRGGMRRMLVPQARRAIARVLGEKGDPLGVISSYIVMYPTAAVTVYVLLPLLCMLIRNEPSQTGTLVTLTVHGNSVSVPVWLLPTIIANLHGRDALQVVRHSAASMAELSSALAFFGMRGLNCWRRRRRAIRTDMIKLGGWNANFAQMLLWSPEIRTPQPEPKGMCLLPPELWEHPYENLHLSTIDRNRGASRLRFWLVASAILALLCW